MSYVEKYYIDFDKWRVWFLSMFYLLPGRITSKKKKNNEKKFLSKK